MLRKKSLRVIWVKKMIVKINRTYEEQPCLTEQCAENTRRSQGLPSGAAVVIGHALSVGSNGAVFRLALRL